MKGVDLICLDAPDSKCISHDCVLVFGGKTVLPLLDPYLLPVQHHVVHLVYSGHAH